MQPQNAKKRGLLPFIRAFSELTEPASSTFDDSKICHTPLIWMIVKPTTQKEFVNAVNTPSKP